MSELSPQAQEIFWAFNSKFDWIEDGVPGSQCKAIAAALRAAAESCQANPKIHIEDISYQQQLYIDGWKDSLDLILAIAAELEGRNA